MSPRKLIRRTINSINYRVIGPLTGRDAKNSGAKTDFRKTHNTQFEILRNTYSLDDAARMAVGGDFDATGLVMRQLLIHQGLQKDDYLIDVGCGSGRLAKPLAEYLDGKYLGIDVVPELLSYARNLVQRPDWRFELAEGLTIPEHDQTADMVCFFSVFTHLLHEESYAYLREAKRVLKPGGKIVLSFLDFRIDTHWKIFENNVADIGNGSKPLDIFISAEMLRAWATHLDLAVEAIKAGDDAFIPLSQPIKFDDGTIANDRAALGQSVCVMVRK
jgi:SAM-dependent methyltransferase